MKVRALPSAKADAEAAGDRLEKEHAGYGSRFAREFRQAVAAIRSAPRQYAPTEDGPEGWETREYFIALFNYRVIYCIWNNEAVILAIVHAARPPGLWSPRVDEATNPEENA